MTRSAGDKRPIKEHNPILNAAKHGDDTRCPDCFIILALAPGHDCMAPLIPKEVDWGNSEWSITQVS